MTKMVPQYMQDMDRYEVMVDGFRIETKAFLPGPNGTFRNAERGFMIIDWPKITLPSGRKVSTRTRNIKILVNASGTLYVRWPQFQTGRTRMDKGTDRPMNPEICGSCRRITDPRKMEEMDAFGPIDPQDREALNLMILEAYRVSFAALVADNSKEMVPA